jgi:sarcosine oxidase
VDTFPVFQPDGGFLLPEACISSYVMLAQARGASVRVRERVLDWQPHSTGVRVRTERGCYYADRLVVSAGAWIQQFVPVLAGKAVPERQVLGWFEPRRADWFMPDKFPVFNLVPTRIQR